MKVGVGIQNGSRITTISYCRITSSYINHQFNLLGSSCNIDVRSYSFNGGSGWIPRSSLIFGTRLHFCNLLCVYETSHFFLISSTKVYNFFIVVYVILIYYCSYKLIWS